MLSVLKTIDEIKVKKKVDKDQKEDKKEDVKKTNYQQEFDASAQLSISEKPMIVGGGLSSYNDLNNLKNLNNKNLEGVIAGKSFYSGSIEIKKGLQILN